MEKIANQAKEIRYTARALTNDGHEVWLFNIKTKEHKASWLSVMPQASHHCWLHPNEISELLREKNAILQWTRVGDDIDPLSAQIYKAEFQCTLSPLDP